MELSISEFLRQEAQKRAQKQATAAATIVMGAIDANPDETAGDLRLANDWAKETGRPVPPLPLVNEYRPVFQKQIEEKRNSTILANNPALTEWLRNPANAAIAKDAVEELSFFENLAIVPRGIASAAPAFNQGAWGLAATVAALPGENRVSQYFLSMARLSEQMSKDVAGPTGGWFGQQVQGASQSIGMMLPGIAATAMTGGTAAPGVAAAYMAPGVISQGGRSAQKGLEAGLSPAQSLYYGALDATAEAVFERIPVGRLLGDIAQGAGFGKILMGQLATEVPTEVATTLFQNLNEFANLTPDRPFGEFLAEQPAAVRDTIAQTVLAVAGLSGMGAGLSAMSRYAQRQQRAAEAATVQAQIEELSGAAAGSKVRARVPDAFRDWVERATDGKPGQTMYVPADRFVEFFQRMGVDAFTIAEELDGVGADDLKVALAAGGDLAIPTATYAARLAGSDADPFFKENARFDPNGFTAAEAREFEAAKFDALEQAWAEAEAMFRDQQDLRTFEQEIFDTMVERLRIAGRATDVARSEAMLFPAFYRVMAERSGMTVQDFMRRYPLPQVRGAIPEGMTARNVDALTLTLAEARQIRRQKPKATTSTPLLDWIAARGGIDDTGGELAARNAAEIKRGRGRKTLRLARPLDAEGRPTMTPEERASGRRFGWDDVAQAAVESGFLADDPRAIEWQNAMRDGTVSPDIVPALMDAIDRELSGQASLTLDEMAAGPTPEERLAEIEEYLAELGLTLDDSDDAIRAALAKAETAPGREYAQGQKRRLLFQAKRGSITFPSAGVGNGETVVNLFRSADLSTLAHESGHYFLTVLQDLAARGEESASAEVETVKGWWRANAADVAKDAARAGEGVTVTADDVIAALDNGTTGDKAKDAAIDVGMQEQFARAFEAYLMEGAAPSLELRSVFERFRAWLVSVYRNLKGLDVHVSDDLRAVFDRLLATDDEIAQARRGAGDAGALFKTAEEMGLTPEAFAAFTKISEEARDEASARLLAETMAPIRRATEQWFKAARATVKAGVQVSMKGRPVYRAIQELRFGKDFDGNDVMPVKLDRAAIERDYGAGYLPLLPGATKDGRGHKLAVFTSEGGMHPDIVAGMYGFRSGQELLDAMTKAQPMAEAIEAETDRIMYERHGDPLKDGTIEAKALDAVHGDKRAQALALELDALNRRTGRDRKSRVAEVREIARQTVARMKVRDAVSVNRFLTAERKAGEEAYRAVASGDYEAAAAAKRRQLLNHALFSEARKVEAMVERIQDRMAALNKPDKRLSKARDIDHIRAARAIAAKFGLARAEPAFDFAAWVEQMRFEDPAAADAMTAAINAYGQPATTYRGLTVEELGALSDAIENVLAQGKAMKSIEIEGRKIERDLAVKELVEVLDNRTQTQNAALSRKLKPVEKFKIGALSVLSSLRRMETWTRDMDDGKAGPFTRYLVKPVMDALGQYRLDRAARLDGLLAIINGRKGALFGKAISAPELGYTFENKAELLHAILHTGNESNLEKLLIGRGWSAGMVNQQPVIGRMGPLFDKDGNPRLTRGKVDTSRWDAFVDRMIQSGTLTKEDFDTAQAIWDLMESLKRPAQATHKKVFGFYFSEIPPRAIDTPFGTYRGGYVPAIADTDASNDGQIRADQQALDAQQTSFMFPTTGSGFTKSRVENYRTPLSLNLMLLPAHMDKVLRFTHLDPVIRQTASLVNNRDLRAAIDGVDKTILPNLVVPWLQRTAQQAVEAQPTTPAGRAAATVFRTLRKRVGVHTMFLNLVNAAQQVTGLSTAMVLVKPGRMKAALARYAKGGAGQMREQAIAASPFMADRILNASRETQGRIQDAITQPTTLGDMKLWIERHGYVLQTAFQGVIDVIAWHGAYDQAIGQGMDHEAAVFEADSVIRRTMGDFSPENVSLFETGNAFTRLFTMFYSYFNAQANLVGGEMQTVMRTMGWEGSGRLFFIYLFGVAIPAIVGEAIVQAARGELGDEDEDGYGDDVLGLFFGSQARFLAGMVPVAGQITTAMINRFNQQFYDDRLSTSPVISTVERAASAPASAYKAATGEGSASRAAGDALTALGLILGIPTGFLVKAGGYGVGVAEGRSEPTGPVDVLQGVISGRDGTE